MLLTLNFDFSMNFNNFQQFAMNFNVVFKRIQNEFNEKRISKIQKGHNEKTTRYDAGYGDKTTFLNLVEWDGSIFSIHSIELCVILIYWYIFELKLIK